MIRQTEASSFGRWTQAYLPKGRRAIALGRPWLRQNRLMPTQLSIGLGESHRLWLTVRASTNPISATGGPVPRINLPLETRLLQSDIKIEILRFRFDLKLGNTLIGQGEIGPLTNLYTSERYFTATATCPREALPYLLNPPPLQGRLTLQLGISGLLRYRHSYSDGDSKAQGLGEAGTWHIEAIGEQGIHELDVQVARSDWYEQVIAPLGTGSRDTAKSFMRSEAA